MFPIAINSLLNTEGSRAKIFFPIKLVIFLFLIVVLSGVKISGKIFKTGKGDQSHLQVISVSVTKDTALAQSCLGSCWTCGSGSINCSVCQAQCGTNPGTTPGTTPTSCYSSCLCSSACTAPTVTIQIQ